LYKEQRFVPASGLPEHYRDEVETIVRDRVRAEFGVEGPGWRPPDGVYEETLYDYYRDAFAEIRGTVKDEVEGVTPGPLDVTPDPLDERTVADAEDLVTLSPSSRSTWEERDNQGERRDIAAFVPSTLPDPSGTSHELVRHPGRAFSLGRGGSRNTFDATPTTCGSWAP